MADEALFDRIEDERPDLAGTFEDDEPEGNEPPEADAPEPVEPPAPPTAPDLNSQIADVVALARQNLERQSQPQQPQQPQQPPAYVDPYERPDLMAQLDDLEERSAYDPEARRQARVVRRQIEDERMNYREQGLRQQISYEAQAPNVMQQAYQEISKGQPNVSKDDWDAVVRDTFGDNNAMAAQVLDPRNPQAAVTRQMLTDAALGRAYRAGRLTPGKPAAAPPAVRSDARNPSTPKNEVLDPEYLSETNKQMRAAAMWRKK